MRRLYERGYDRETVQELFRIIDWLVQLPETLEQRFMAQVHELEEERKMHFVAPAERIWKQEGKQEGKQEAEATMLIRLVERRFGEGAADRYQEQIEAADADTLLRWFDQALTAESLTEVFGEG